MCGSAEVRGAGGAAAANALWVGDRPVVAVYKPRGWTPLQAVRAVLPDEKAGYAGRLDPLARGVLVVVRGAGLARQEELQHTDKVYEFEVLLGISSDSCDVLGLPSAGPGGSAFADGGAALRALARDGGGAAATSPWAAQAAALRDALWRWRGSHRQLVPAYSAVRVAGRPLFWWARRGRLAEVRTRLPPRSGRIAALEWLGARPLTAAEVLAAVHRRIGAVTGDFRQAEAAAAWKRLLARQPARQYAVAAVRATVSSGTYVRALARDMGAALGCGALAWDIHRVRCGVYSVADCVCAAHRQCVGGVAGCGCTAADD